jgi:PiT family inorganic phosphate transporter
MNDTPKIAALLLILPAIGAIGSLGLVGLIIAVGGITSARRVAEVMSRQITPMNHGQGVTANFVTSCIAILATTNGLPISTTHVSCGTLFGIGIVTKQARYSMIARILLAWVTTLPVAVILSALAFQGLQMIP